MSAKMFVLNLKESSKRGFAYSREKGIYPASAMPPGYLSYRDRNGKRVIELDKKKAPKIKKLFEVYAQGSQSTYTLVDMAVNFNLYKKPRDKIGRKKIVNNLRRMFKNPFYMGEMLYKNQRFPHAHEKLISREIYEKCQKIISKKRRNPKYGMYKHSETLLHNLGSCGSCGSRLVHAYNRSYPPRPKEYYQCSSARWSSRARCDQHSIRHDTALEETLLALKRLSYSIESRDSLEIQIPILTRGISKNYKVLLADTSDEIKKIENEIKKLIKSYLNRIITLKDYYEIRNELELNKIEQNKKLDYYKKCYKNLSGKFISIIDFASNAASNFQNTENDLEKRKILFMIFEKILLKEGKLEFVYRRPLNILIEEREKKLSWPSIINKIKNQYLEEAISFYTNTDEITNYDIMYKSA